MQKADEQTEYLTSCGIKTKINENN